MTEVHDAGSLSNGLNSAKAAIDYACMNKQAAPRGADAGYAEVIAVCRLTAGTAAILLLVECMTDSLLLPSLALLWLLLGGLMTLCAFIEGLLYCCSVARAGFPPPHSLRRAMLAAMLPLVNVPLAYALFRYSVARLLAGSFI